MPTPLLLKNSNKTFTSHAPFGVYNNLATDKLYTWQLLICPCILITAIVAHNKLIWLFWQQMDKVNDDVHLCTR